MTSTRTASHASFYHVGYSLTCAEYDDLLAIARGCCMACEKDAAPLCFDHDHKLGWWAVRGLVCRSCNQQLRRVDSGEKAATAALAQYLADAWHLRQPSSTVKKARVKPRVDCSVCGLDFAVSASGGPWWHWSRLPGDDGLCAGSPPGSSVPAISLPVTFKQPETKREPESASDIAAFFRRRNGGQG